MLDYPGLSRFLSVIQRYEEGAGLEGYFWQAHDALGNFLTRPFQQWRSDTNELDLFLRKWNSLRTPIQWNGFEELWSPEMLRISSICSAFSLEGCDFRQDIGLPRDRLSLENAAQKLYYQLQQVHGIGPTNASKLLAIAMPQLFVMWDGRNIRSPHNIRGTARAYTDFLKEMQQWANQIVKEAARTNHSTVAESRTWLEALPLHWKSQAPRSKPLAKLLDEYNYSTGRERN